MSKLLFLSCASLAAACAIPLGEPKSRAPSQPATAASAKTVASQPAAVLFEVVMVDDSTDRFAIPAGSELPEGVALPEEHITWSRLENKPVLHFVHLLPRSDDDLSHVLARVDPWLRRFALPADARLGWQGFYQYHDGSLEPAFGGWRSFVLRGAPLITERDIASVSAERGDDGAWGLAIQLTATARERFRIATRDHVRERMAIMLEGMVSSAPIIMSEISGGKVHLLLDESSDTADAKRLVKILSAASVR